MNISAFAYALAGAWIVSISLYFLLTRVDLIRRILALNVMGSGIFLLLVAMARRAPLGPPDPVPHALVLTGIVVSVSASALLMAMSCRRAELSEEGEEAE